MAKTKTVFSGMRPTGRLHLGNYLGGVKGMLELQDNPQYKTIYAVVDLHATTTPYDKKTLSSNAKEIILDYLACGLDPEKSIIYRQSDLADLLTQLMFYFSTVTTVARMQHLPTYKDKIKQHPNHVTMALLNYPVLMAADILIYKASLVPVGIDQEPHLEVSREIARKMNEEYGTDFPEPKRFATKGEYVPSLTGEGKMSKSIEGSYINLTDDLKTIRAKIAKIPTDSGKGSEIEPETGGILTLFTLISLFEGKEKMEKYARERVTTGVKYSEVKEELAQAIFKELEPIQKKRKELEAKPEYISQILENGAAKARKIAQEVVNEIKVKMGLK